MTVGFVSLGNVIDALVISGLDGAELTIELELPVTLIIELSEV